MRYRSGWSLRGRLLVLGALAAVAVGVFGAGTAAASTPKALINGDTIYNGSSSVEAQEAAALGFSVDIVSGSTWDSMSQSDFAQYQVLIVGDPACGGLASSVTANASTWAPVVMGTAGGHTQAGNRILIGTDPIYHYLFSGRGGARTLIHDGIAFAGAQPGRTGLYFDDTCAGAGAAIPTLNQLSTGSGSWSGGFPPCGGTASLIASNGAFDTLHSTDLQGWFCSIHETFPTYPSDWTPLAIATDASSHPTCGIDVDTGGAACGEAYILIAGSDIVVSAPDISVTPTDQSPSGSSATVSAHVEEGGSPLASQTVDWTVTGLNNGATGTCAPADCKTDSNGDVSFTYSNANGTGDDTVVASFTTSGGSFEQASGAVHWTKVADTTPPTLGPVSDVTVEATGPDGATASYDTPTATDDTDPAPTVSCAPASGTQFAVGDTLVTCTATDASGNSADTSFTVHVVDTTPPTLTLPDDQTLEATGPGGAAASWSDPTATDIVDGTTTVTCDATSGSTFALGTTAVTCSSTDAHGNTATGSFDVTVVDTTPPSLSLPTGITVDAASPAGTTVTYSTSATDIVDGATAVTCSPASGSTFAIGTTTVNCSSTDAHGNTSTGSFTVHVRSAAEMIAPFCSSLKGVAPGTSLYDKCTSAANYVAIGDPADAIATLKAFDHEVAAQRGKKLTAAKADSLTASANAIIAALGG